MKWDFQLPHPSIRFALTDWWGIGQTHFVNGTVTLAADPAHPGQFSRAQSSRDQFGIKLLQDGHISAGFPAASGRSARLPYITTNARSIHLAKGVSPAVFLNNCGYFRGDEIRYHKDNTLGLSADYFEPFTGVVVRVESSWTHNALVNDTDSLDWTSNNDIMQYVIGFDRPHFIKFLNPDRTFFSSFQVFETYYPGAHSSNGGKDGIVRVSTTSPSRRSPRRTTIATRSSRWSSQPSGPRERTRRSAATPSGSSTTTGRRRSASTPSSASRISTT